MSTIQSSHRRIIAFVILLLLSLITIPGGAVLGTRSSDSEEQKLPRLPKFKNPIDDPDRIQELYRFAALHPEILSYMPCFCACSRTKHHHSNEDCFVKSRGQSLSSVKWTDHAGECTICLTVARTAKEMYEQGKTVQQIRQAIEASLGSKFTKYHTDTPLPPNAAVVK